MEQSPPKSNISFNYLTNSSKDDQDLLNQLTKRLGNQHQHQSYQQSNLSFKPFNFYEPSKQTTRQYFYDQMLKQISLARQTKLNLRDQYQHLQQQLTKKYLGNLIDELKELSIENESLRSQHYQSTKTRNRKSSFYNETPKSRKSIPAVIANHPIKRQFQKQSQLSNSKYTKSPGLKRLGHIKAHSTIFESTKFQNKLKQINSFNNITTNFDKTSLVKLNHKRSQSRLLDITDRKENYSPISQKNFCSQLQQSIFDSSQSLIKQSSQASLNRRYASSNIFLELLSVLTQQEKMLQNQFMDQLNMNVNYQLNDSFMNKGHEKKYFLDQLQKKIQITQSRVRQLNGLVQQFERQIKAVNQSYAQANQLTQLLLTTKGQAFKREQYSEKLKFLKKQLKQKQSELHRLHTKRYINSSLPNSFKLFLILMGVEPSEKIVDAYQQIHRVIKNPQKFKLKNHKQRSKIIEISKNIDEGRRKFNQLCRIYQTRIKTVKEKIKRKEKQTCNK